MIVPARECHVCQLATAGLRGADLEEIAATSGEEPGAALRSSMERSKRTWVSLDSSGFPYAIFGVADFPDAPDLGCPWMLATDDLLRHRRDVARFTPVYVEEMGKGYDALTNFVSIHHVDSIRWLMRAGFNFIDCVPYGVSQQPFYQFWRAT